MSSKELTKEWMIQLRFMLKDTLETYEVHNRNNGYGDGEFKNTIENLNEQIKQIAKLLTTIKDEQ